MKFLTTSDAIYEALYNEKCDRSHWHQPLENEKRTRAAAKWPDELDRIVLNAIVHTCSSGFPTGHVDLRTALQTQDALCAALSWLELPEEEELEGEEPEEEVETVNRGGAPVTAYLLWQPGPSLDMFE